jgi:adenylate cyclase
MTRAAFDPSWQRWRWLVPACALALVTAVMCIDPPVLRQLRHLVFDHFQRWEPRTQVNMPVRIVDIDDESLRRLGQWPWPRDRVARLIDQLARAGPASIALDIVFAEPDRTSPRTLLSGAAIPVDTARYIESLPDHDEVLTQALARANVAIGFALNHEVTDRALDAPTGPDPLTKARFVTIGDSPLRYLPTFASSVPSLEAFRRAAAGHGAMTFVPDTDGVIRKVPVLANLDGMPVPSLVAEALRLARKGANYSVRTASEGGGLTDVSVGDLRMITDAEGAMWVHYSRPIADRYIPAWRLLAGDVATSELAGRVVLVGTSAQGLMDLRFSPLGGIIPGVEVHAQALEQVLSGQQLARPSWAPGAEILSALAGCVLVGAVAMLAGAAASIATLGAAVLVLWLIAWQAFSRAGLLLDPAVGTLALFALFVPSTLVRHLLSEQRQRWVRNAFARYVSPNLVDYLIGHPGALELGGRRQRCSFVFADVAGFTTTMETMEPVLAVSILNEYLDSMIAIAFENEGTLDRIVGDSIAIVFSAPVEQSDHQARALRCALAMQRFARAFVIDLAARGISFGETRFGVHTGEVTVGNFGGSTIFDYRALGDPVNTASRLEGANKYLGTLICVSEATMAGCAGAPARPIGRLSLSGRVEPVTACEPLDPIGQADGDPAYATAYRLMATHRSEARGAFEALAHQRPNDPLVQLHWRRLRAGATGDLIELHAK